MLTPSPSPSPPTLSLTLALIFTSSPFALAPLSPSPPHRQASSKRRTFQPEQRAVAISSISALLTRTSFPWASASRLSTSGTSTAVASFDSKLQENASIGADSPITSDYFRSLQGNQASEQQNHTIQGEPQCNVASEQRPAPHFDLSTSPAIGEADIEAELQRALFGEAAGLPSAEPVVFGSSLSPIAEGADLPIAESTLLEPAPADEFGQDLASMIWKANQAGGGADGSRSSSVSSVVGRIAAANLDDAGETPRCAPCWGAQLNGSAMCIPQFAPGKLHFKNKFCDNCKDSIVVPTSRVCALTTELAARFVNRRSEGFWNHAPASMGGGQYRIINNTAGSIGPRLALFRDQPPPCDWSATRRDRTTDMALLA